MSTVVEQQTLFVFARNSLELLRTLRSKFYEGCSVSM